MTDQDSRLETASADLEEDTGSLGSAPGRVRDASGVVQTADQPPLSRAERRVEHLLDQLEDLTDPGPRAELLRELATLYEGAELQEPDHARLAWVEALCEEPEHPETVAAVERLTRTAEQWLEVLQSLQEASHHAAHQDSAYQAQLASRLGRWYDAELGRTDLGLAYANRAAQLAPADGATWTRLAEIQRRAHVYQDLTTSLLHLASLCDDAREAADRRTEAGRVLFHQLSDAERAAPLFLQVLEAQPDHAEAAAELSALWRQAGRWEELTDLLARRAALAEPEEATRQHLELAALCEQELDDPEKAATHYTVAAESDPTPKTLEALARVQHRSGDIAASLATLDRLIRRADAPATRLAGLWQAARLLEERREYRSAAERLEQAVELDPGDERAYAELARLYRRLLDGERLVHTLERHARASDDPSVKQRYLLEAARTALGDRGDRKLALALCERLLALDPDHLEALRLLARLREGEGERLDAAEVLETLAHAEKEPEKQAQRWFEAGKLRQAEGDAEGAQASYEQALKAWPDMADANEALGALHRSSGDAHGLLAWLGKRAETTEDPQRRSTLLAEAAHVCRDRLEDPALAQSTFLQSLALAPDNAVAALALGEMAFEEGDAASTVRYLQPLQSRAGELVPSQVVHASVLCGLAQEQLGDYLLAEQAYQRAATLAPEDTVPKLRLALLASAVGDHAAAAPELEALLELPDDALTTEQRVSAWVALSEAHVALDAPERAAQLLRKALERTADHPSLLEALSAAWRAKGDHEALLTTLRRRHAVADDDGVRVSVLLEIATVLSDSLSREDEAIQTLEGALQLGVEERRTLTRLMSLYSETERWEELLRTLQRLAELSDDDSVRAKYLATAASVSERHMEDPARAARGFAEVVALQPDDTRSFARYLDCLQACDDHAARVGALRERLDQLEDADDADARAQLADQLATALQDAGEPLAERVEATKLAYELSPDETRRSAWLDTMGEAPADYGEPMVEAVKELQRERPRDARAFHAIYDVYEALDLLDAKWCAAQALKSLGEASDEQVALFRQHRKLHAAEAQACIDDEIWQASIEHPEQSSLVTDLFAMLMPAALHVYSLPLDQHGIDPRHRVDPSRDPRLMVRMLHYTAGVLDVDLPPVFHHARDSGGVTLLPSDGLTVAFGAAALADVPDQAVAFAAGQKLSYLRRGHALRLLEPTGSGLRAWLLAAIRTTEDSFPVPDELRARVNHNLRALQGVLRAEELRELGDHVHHLLTQAPELDMKRWALGVDFSADRVGFMLSDSLAASIAMIQAGGTGDEVERRIDELYAYSVSPEYLSLRRQLGIAVV